MAENIERTLRRLMRRGFVALTHGKLQEAADCCKQAIALKPDLAQAHFLVGLTALQANDRQTAFQAFGSVTQIDEKNAAAWAQLARLFMTEGQVVKADAALLEATQADSRDPMVHDLIGTVYSQIGEYAGARASFETAVQLKPDHPPFLLNLANNRIYEGDTQGAEVLLDKIITIQPNSPQAHWALAGSRKAVDERHINVMSGFANEVDLHPRARSFYFYAMGKEFEDLEQWGRAFNAFEQGARTRRTTIEYDEKAEQQMFDFLRDKFTSDWLARCSAGYEEAGPIFVLGQPRTGTTMIERIITSHSAVDSAGELQQLGLAVRRLSDHRDPKRFSTAFFETSLQIAPATLGKMYLDTTAKLRGSAAFFVDKLPQNYLMIPLILAALPKAKIVHLTRNPMDACFSSFKQLFADAYLHSYDQEEMARHHVRYLTLMSVWRDRFGDRFIDIAYEDTVADIEPNARRLIDFLGLEWEEACLSFHQQSGAVSTASAVQVREPAHTRSVNRWRRYEGQLQPMLNIVKSYLDDSRSQPYSQRADVRSTSTK